VLAFTLPDHDDASHAMGRAWVAHPSWELVDAASDAVGLDVAHLLLDADAEELCDPVRAHLATVVLSLVGVDAAERLGLVPMSVAGYGAGELTALVAAGTLSFDDGVRLARDRGAAAAATRGAQPCVAALVRGLSDDDVAAACARAEGGAWVAGQMAPGLVVLAGTTEGVGRAIELSIAMGATEASAPLESSGLHTPLAAVARERYRKSLGEAAFADPDPVPVANVDGRAHPDAAEWPGLLSAQLCAPVRWRTTVETMFTEGVRTFVAFGPGEQISRAARSSLPPRAVQAHAIGSPEDLDELVARLIATPSLRRRSVADHATLASRLVVSCATGPFRPAPDVAHAMPKLAGLSEDDEAGEVHVEVGDLLGWVGDDEVRSAFAGTLGGLLVIDGERVIASQPVAWLHVGEAA